MGKDVSSRFIAPQARRFRQEVWWIIRETLQLPVVPLTGRLNVTVLLYPKDARRRDIDNPIKFLIDSLQAANLFNDDSQIDRLLVERREIYSPGKCVVTIESLELSK